MKWLFWLKQWTSGVAPPTIRSIHVINRSRRIPIADGATARVARATGAQQQRPSVTQSQQDE